MVLLAAAICNKAGKYIISRQFVEMTKARIEGLLAAFPKLKGSEKQHTFVETESVRYVYQPLEKLYVLLITTKASNILEDLETLRLFGRVVPEYCSQLDEKEVVEQAFPLLFAFDEIVALGYRESVNLNQIRTFIEMDSHEERVFQAVRETQEREARENAKRKAKELELKRKAMIKSGQSSLAGHGLSGESLLLEGTQLAEPMRPPAPIPNSYSGLAKHQQEQRRGGRGMKLGAHSRDSDHFIDELRREGEAVEPAGSTSTNAGGPSTTGPSAASRTPSMPVMLKLEEKLTVKTTRDGDVSLFKVAGSLVLRVSDQQYGRIHVQLDNMDRRKYAFQAHPNIDKALFNSKGIIGAKVPDRPFPINMDTVVLKWRHHPADDGAAADQLLPIAITCWPDPRPNGGCNVSVQYDLGQGDVYELLDVEIVIPLPMGSGNPVVASCDGDYHYDRGKSQLIWSIKHVNAVNKQGLLEFSVSTGHQENFFPIEVQFRSERLYLKMDVADVLTLAPADDGDAGEASVPYGCDTSMATDSYEIV